MIEVNLLGAITATEVFLGQRGNSERRRLLKNREDDVGATDGQSSTSGGRTVQRYRGSLAVNGRAGL